MSANHAELMLYRHCREGRGDRTALYFRGEMYGYEEIADAAASCASWLRATGITDGDAVLVSLPDCPTLAAIYFGIVTVGALAILVDPSLPTEDTFYIAQLAGAKLSIAHEASIERVMPLQFLPGMIAVLAAGLSWRASSEIVASVTVTHPADYPLPPNSDGPAYGLLSSGSTGRPKLIVHRHGDIRHAYNAFALPVADFAATDRAICVAKLTTGYGMGCSILMPFLAGASAALVAEPPGPAHSEAIAAYGCTLLFAQPRFLAESLSRADAPAGWPSLRLAMTGGEPLGNSLQDRWRRFSEIELLDSYGSTEVGFLYIANRPGRARRGSVGEPVDGVEIEIVDDAAELVPVGQIGRLRVRGPMVVQGYWNDPERTAHAFRDGWFTTSDMFSVDADGYYYIHGRSDYMIKLGCGDWVNPVELEKVLLEHAAVDECAIVGAPNDSGLVSLKAVVVARGAKLGPTLASELSALVRQRWPLQDFKHLGFVEFAPALPKTVAGKLDRSKLSPASMTEFSYKC
jgi:acyl-coenzyme A synthetase/AMP-(fatty) acid ligase